MAATTERKKRSNVSDYLILKKDGTYQIVAERKKLGVIVSDVGVNKIAAIYRGTKLDFRIVHEVKIGKPKWTVDPDKKE